MRPLILSTLALVGLSQAATLYVLEGASAAGQYSSITAALSAASNGDTIAIKNRKGNLPWNETVQVSKSVYLTRVADAEDWQLNGGLNITGGTKVVVSDMVQATSGWLTVGNVDSLIVINSEISNSIGVNNPPQSGSFVGFYSSNINTAFFIDKYYVEFVNVKSSGNLEIYNGSAFGLECKKLKILENHSQGITKIQGSKIDSLLELSGSNLKYNISNNNIRVLSVNSGSYDSIWIAHNSIRDSLVLKTQAHIYHNNVTRISGNSLGGSDIYYNTGFDLSGNVIAPVIYSVYSTPRLNFKNQANLTQGNPDPIYNNVDGTRATIGIEGGPTPYSNWTRAGRLTPSATQARVYDLTLPASVKTGEVIPVTIKAYDH